jgi:type I restriction enzyme M protein
VVISNPPIGKIDQHTLDFLDSELGAFSGKVETAFTELTVKLLRDGGRAALLLPEGFFFSQDRQRFRSWLLGQVKIDAIITLPRGAWTSGKSFTQASVLLFTKKQQPTGVEYPVFIADLRATSGEAHSESELQLCLNQTREAFLKFWGDRDCGFHITNQRSSARIVSSNLISSDRFDVAGIMLEAWKLSPLALSGKYSVAKLNEVADIVLGRHIKRIGDRDPTIKTANYIQAGNVRRFEIDLADVVKISEYEMKAGAAAFLKKGDVLITSTGQYLGRAALVIDEQLPAIASNAVTILRIRDPHIIDPRYLVALLNSPAGVEQFEQRRIKGVAQPYLRKSDVEEIAIPLPPLEVQLSAAHEIWDLLAKADGMIVEADKMRARAHNLLVEVLSERPIP